MQPMMFVRKLKWVTSTSRVHTHFRETSASSVFPVEVVMTPSHSSEVENPTLDFGFQNLQELLINPYESLFPFTKPYNGLSYLF